MVTSEQPSQCFLPSHRRSYQPRHRRISRLTGCAISVVNDLASFRSASERRKVVHYVLEVSRPVEPALPLALLTDSKELLTSEVEKTRRFKLLSHSKIQ